MTKLNELNDNHSFGSLIYYKKDSQIICLSGWHNRKVEKYHDDDLILGFTNTISRASLSKKKENIIKHIWTYLPEMKVERGESPYAIINEVELYAFFGYNCPKACYINSIEKLNLDDPIQWEEIKFSNENHLSTSIKSHSCVRINDKIIFLGGFDGQNEKPLEDFFEYDITKVTLNSLGGRKYPEIVQNHFYNFQNDSALVPFKDFKNRLHYAGFDEKDQVHTIDTTMFEYDLFKFD
jgi:hypothetical protein